MPRPFQPGLIHTPKGRYGRVMSCIMGQKRATQICPPTPDLTGKLTLVTGGTGGIGAEIVKGLSVRGAEVIAAARGKASSAETVEQWAQPGDGQIRFLPLDLGSLAGIHASLERIATRWPGRKIEILCANAGIWAQKYWQSEDGYEASFAINCLGHHALIRGLQERGLLADNARIVGTTGDIYVLAEDCTEDFTFKGRGMAAYCRSKLGNLWQYRELARRYPQLTVIAVHPGVVATNLEGSSEGLTGAIKRAIMISPEQGAQSSLIAATQDLPSGSYFHNKYGQMQLPEHDPAMQDAKAREFWNILENALPEPSETPAPVTIGA
ncbi:MAG: SDR family NAD(P)-dependent oxidoreductase [Pseudomonadota bacterium]